MAQAEHIQHGSAAETDTPAGSGNPTEARLAAVMEAARYHSTELDRGDLRFPPDAPVAPAVLVEWIRAGGLWARAVRMSWRNLLKVESGAPVVLLLRDGGAVLLTQVDAARNMVWIKNPLATTDQPPIPVDELRLSQMWSGEVMLIRGLRGASDELALFNLSWLANLVLMERRTLRDVCIASVALSVLTIVPPLIVMQVVNRVITHESYSTLAMISMVLAVAVVYECFLGYARRQMMLIIGARVDAKLNLHVFPAAARPAAGFLREASGRLNHLQHQPGL